MWSTVRSDLAQAVRTLVRQRALTLTALFSLAVGSGIAAAAFTLLNAMILRPLPGVQAQDRLLVLGLSLQTEHGRSPPGRFSHPDYVTLRDAALPFEELAATAAARVSIDSAAGSSLTTAERVTSNYFRVLGAQPARGRFFDDADAVAGAVAIVAHWVWQDRLGGDPQVVGRHLIVNGEPFTIVGVTAAGFHGSSPPDALDRPESRIGLWLPLGAVAQLHPPGMAEDPMRALDQLWLRPVGRVRAGTTMAAARAQVAALGAVLAQAYPRERAGARVAAGDVIFGPGTSAVRGTLTITAFMVLPLLVLLIACVNVANLLLASGATRQRELAIRLSLGATRSQLVRQLLRESLLLALGAGMLGLLVAAWSGRIAALFSIRAHVPVPIDGRVLLFTFIVVLATSLAFGLLPALRATRVAPRSVLSGGASSESGAAARLRRGLVVAQLAASFILLTVCALFVRSVQTGNRVESGMAEPQMLLVGVDVGVLGGSPADGMLLFDRLDAALASMPRVEAVGTSPSAPLHGARDVRVASATDPATGLNTSTAEVGGSYFAATGTPLLAGRELTPGDSDASTRGIVVNRSLAERLWPGQTPLGREVSIGDAADTSSATVVGVVADVRTSLLRPAAPMVYRPIGQPYSSRRTYVIRVAGEPRSLAPAVHRAVHGVEPRLPPLDISTMRGVRSEALLPWRLMGIGLGSLGMIALLLAAVGLYGLIAYHVARRSREIGVRMALGANRADIVRWVLHGSAATCAVGIGIGALLAGTVAFAIRGGLHGVAPLDPLTFAATAALLLAVAVLAAVLPARRAAGVQPCLGIRAE